TENVILSLAGAGLGLLLAVWGVAGLVALEPRDLPRLAEVRVDGAVVAFTAGLALLTGLLFGLVPAYQSARSSLFETMREAGRGLPASRAAARTRRVLVVAEIGLALVLLSGAGLLIRSLARLASVDPGFRADRVLTFELSLPEVKYRTDPQQV